MSKAILLLPIVILFVGCSRDKTAEQVGEMNKSNIQRLGNMYAAHQNFKAGRGPKNDAEFREFISTFDPNKLKMMGIKSDSLDELFTSENDGKPFKVRYSVGGGRGSQDPVIFEVEGKNGKKQVGYTGGKVEDADDATYALLLSGKGGGGGGASTGGPPGGKDGGRPSGIPAGAPKGPGQ